MTALIPTNESSLLNERAPSNAPVLRIEGAGDAPGFAQVLQAFDRQEPSLASQSETEEDRSGAQNAEEDDTVRGNENQGESTSAKDAARDEGGAPSSADARADAEPRPDASREPEQVHPGASEPESGEPQIISNEQAGQANHEHGHAPQAAKSSAVEGQASPQAADEAGIKTEAQGLGLLENKSDQAKLSIRGLVRAIRADSAQDSTTLAVQTRLGQAQGAASEQPAQAQAQAHPPVQKQAGEPDAVPVTPKTLGTSDPRNALSDTAPTSPKGAIENARAPSTPTPGQGVAGNPRADSVPSDRQANPSTQQARSVRADAPVQASGVKFSDPGRAEALHSVVRGETISRVEGALTARAVSAVDASGSPSGIDANAANAKQALMSGEQRALQTQLMAQVQRGLASLMRSAGGEMTLRLTPERLGELKIEIKRVGDQLAIRLTTQTSEARELLTGGSGDLTRQLQAKGIDIERVLIEQEPADAPDQQLSGDANDGRQPGHEQGGGQPHRAGTLATGEGGDEPAPDAGPRDIWTELGLDAIA